MTNNTVKAILLLNAASVLWAGNIILGSLMKDQIGPWSIMSFRLLLGGIIFIVLLNFNGQLNNVRRLIGWRPLMLMALTGIVGYQSLLYYGLHWTSSINTGLINGLMPFMTSFLAVIYLKEKLDFHHWLAACLSISGLILIISYGDLSNLYQLKFNFGDLLIFLSVFFWAVYSVTGKFMMQNMSPLLVTAIGVLLAMVIVVPLGIFEWNYIQRPVLSSQVIIGLIYIGIGPTVLSLLFWNKGVHLIGPSRSSLFLNTVPIYTIILSIIFLDDELYLYHLLGLIMILAGSLYASSRYKPEISQPVVNKN